MIIHKLTEDIDRKESAEKINALNAYLAAHQQTSIVDPLEAVRKVISRARCCESLAKIINKLGANCPFTQPRFVLVDAERENLADYIQQMMAIEGFTFPVICKPVEACGTPNSHRMVRENNCTTFTGFLLRQMSSCLYLCDGLLLESTITGNTLLGIHSLMIFDYLR